jgi:hypothetical protein
MLSVTRQHLACTPSLNRRPCTSGSAVIRSRRPHQHRTNHSHGHVQQSGVFAERQGLPATAVACAARLNRWPTLQVTCKL